MDNPFFQPPITFKTLCAIARTVILKRPRFTDAEWKEAVKLIVAKQGWTATQPDELARALSAVEHALTETTGWRRAAVTDALISPPPDRCWTTADYRALARLLDDIARRDAALGVAAAMTHSPEAVFLELSEAAALNQFYAQATIERDVALRLFAEIAIVRPAEWDYDAVRAAAETVRIGRECFCCRHSDRRIQRHHIIQIQHGGSNYAQNVIPLCVNCHHVVHPWLPKPKTTSGWLSLADIWREATNDERIKKPVRSGV